MIGRPSPRKRRGFSGVCQAKDIHCAPRKAWRLSSVLMVDEDGFLVRSRISLPLGPSRGRWRANGNIKTDEQFDGRPPDRLNDGSLPGVDLPLPPCREIAAGAQLPDLFCYSCFLEIEFRDAGRAGRTLSLIFYDCLPLRLQFISRRLCRSFEFRQSERHFQV